MTTQTKTLIIQFRCIEYKIVVDPPLNETEDDTQDEAPRSAK